MVKKNIDGFWDIPEQIESGKTTGLSENIIRNFALQHNRHHKNIFALSMEWSGLKKTVQVSKR